MYEDAKNAITKYNNTKFNDKKIKVDWAMSKEEKAKVLPPKPKKNSIIILYNILLKNSIK